MTQERLLSVRDLSLEVAQRGVEVVKKVSFDIEPGEIFGIVGESGSGKSLATRAIISLLPPAIKVTGGQVTFKGRDVLTMSEAGLRELRGAEIGLVFQEPMTSLNPSMTIGRQLEEGLTLHTNMQPATRRERILAMLQRVGIRDPEGALSAYPHEFSGGMRQRIMLASVMLLKPALLIADEPTTALDAVIQRDVMELMVELTKAEGTAVLLISHDLPMVARYTSRIVVMEKGALVEQGTTEQILEKPQHPYTRKLLSSLPIRGEVRAIDTVSAPMISARNIVVDYPGRKSLFKKAVPKRALHGVSVDIHAGEVVALVGGSGSGKTTLGRTIAGLVNQSSGDILFQGRERSADWRDYRLNCQMVFQDPYSSLDPRMTILSLVEEALRLVPGYRPGGQEETRL
jgi:peptide/nickel transport system ATP-binding protein